jgi:hypothetical protein
MYKIAAAIFFVTTTIASTNAPPFLSNTVQITNSSSKKVKRLFASADGQGFAAVNIGSGIGPSETLGVDLNSEGGTRCSWRLKVVYADRSASTSRQFNICNEYVAIEFK